MIRKIQNISFLRGPIQPQMPPNVLKKNWDNLDLQCGAKKIGIISSIYALVVLSLSDDATPAGNASSLPAERLGARL